MLFDRLDDSCIYMDEFIKKDLAFVLNSLICFVYFNTNLL